MKINYDIENTDSIIHSLFQTIQEIEALDTQLLAEFDTISSIYNSQSGKVMLSNFIQNYENYMKSFSSFVDALSVLCNVHGLYTESFSLIKEAVIQLKN